jgi:hypothetical protein
MFRRVSSFLPIRIGIYVMVLKILPCTHPVVPVDQDYPCCESSDLHMPCDACCSSTREHAAYNIDD